MRKFLQTYRLVVEAGAIENYATALGGLTESELDVALDRANRENETDFAPGPGVIYEIAMEVRAGSKVQPWSEEQRRDFETPNPHPEWVEDDEWKKLKQKVGSK